MYKRQELRRASDEAEPPRILELETLNKKLGQELEDAYETIEVLKSVVMTESTK